MNLKPTNLLIVSPVIVQNITQPVCNCKHVVVCLLLRRHPSCVTRCESLMLVGQRRLELLLMLVPSARHFRFRGQVSASAGFSR